MRTNLDLTPFLRSSVGFDRVFDLLESSAGEDRGELARLRRRQDGDERHRVNVTGANPINGLLTIELDRDVPEAMKPRRIAIGTDSILPEPQKQIARSLRFRRPRAPGCRSSICKATLNKRKSW
jgi:HSP20 family molecular chaperone IbpA